MSCWVLLVSIAKWQNITATRAQVLTLAMISKLKYDKISAITGVTKGAISNIVKKAMERGSEGGAIVDEYVADKPQPGRPKTVNPEIEEKILDSVRKDRTGREKPTEYLAFEAGISRSPCHRVLKRHGFNKVKPTMKPGLSDKAKQKRLEFCPRHKHWTLEDSKNVIWSDETSVVLGHRRGGQRLWRTPSEATEPTCIRRRWKGTQEFIFWDALAMTKKGQVIFTYPSHLQTERRRRRR